MNTTQKTNTFAIGLPIVILATYPLFKEGALILVLISTMLTGFIQVLIGFILLTDNPKNKHYQFYLLSVFTFFLVWFSITTIKYYDDYLMYPLIAIPSILSIYLSFLIYKKE